MKHVRISLNEAEALLTEIHLKMSEAALTDEFDASAWTPRGIIDAAGIIRETVLAIEAQRINANRKPRAAKVAA